MIAGANVAKIAHLALMKIIAFKTAIGVSVLVSSTATALIATGAIDTAYFIRTGTSVSDAVGARFRKEKMLTSSAQSSIDTTDVIRKSFSSDHSSVVEQIGMSDLVVNTPDIPQVVITAKRMTLEEKKRFDLETATQIIAMFNR